MTGSELLVFIFMIFVFFTWMFILSCDASVVSLSDLSWMSRWWLDNILISSAKSRSSSDEVSVHWIPLFCPSFVCLISQSIARTKRTGERMHPCLTPVCTLKLSVSWFPQITLQWKSLYSIWIMLTIFIGKPYPLRIFQRISWCKLSNAFSKSMNST